ncbi:Putative peptidoglycan binding domain-containing protein [Gracilibacillus ureilyticus]|uniref:Putative peptidoglycan binding domain-containing protein n=1 Tax=Gracilibacillus ureilyticus TaxID=531814 RepID=A0A1H9LKI8_9BACI|nr:NlpC/P60 family protein [Gracilibacillus ureilyticus]SER11930.1 Putative peptidoglycan binding domain-containing protein [Gracilibacillus ureilyticus]
MLLHDHLSTVVKHSVAYSFVFSQPFSFYIDASFSQVENEIFEQAPVLSYGMHHDTVRVLQKKLQKLSYYDSSIDGKFGTLTEYALKKFQKDQQMKISGEADKETIQRIIQREAQTYENILTAHISNDSADETNKEDVEKLQEALNYYGYYKSSIDGLYGPVTDKALQAYKQDRGIETVHIENEITISSAQSETEHTYIQTSNSSDQTVPESSNEKSIPAASSNLQGIISTAKAYYGVPYVWGGTTSAGFDCSGYIQFVFNQYNVQLPRTVNEMWNATKPIAQPAVGDLVFFETYKPGPSHAGIYIGNGQFIHAGASNGVEISPLDQAYWSERYLGAKRVISE